MPLSMPRGAGAWFTLVRAVPSGRAGTPGAVPGRPCTGWGSQASPPCPLLPGQCLPASPSALPRPLSQASPLVGASPGWGCWGVLAWNSAACLFMVHTGGAGAGIYPSRYAGEAWSPQPQLLAGGFWGVRIQDPLCQPGCHKWERGVGHRAQGTLWCYTACCSDTLAIIIIIIIIP